MQRDTLDRDLPCRRPTELRIVVAQRDEELLSARQEHDLVQERDLQHTVAVLHGAAPSVTTAPFAVEIAATTCFHDAPAYRIVTLPAPKVSNGPPGPQDASLQGRAGEIDADDSGWRELHVPRRRRVWLRVLEYDAAARARAAREVVPEPGDCRVLNRRPGAPVDEKMLRPGEQPVRRRRRAEIHDEVLPRLDDQRRDGERVETPAVGASG